MRTVLYPAWSVPPGVLPKPWPGPSLVRDKKACDAPPVMEGNPQRGAEPSAGGAAPHAPRVLAQASTTKPKRMRYMANGANPRRRTQAMNHATLA